MIPTSVNIGGKVFTLEHLSYEAVTLVGHGREGADILVRISVTSHVYSKTPAAGQQADFYDENGKARVFCSYRYSRSKQLMSFCVASVENNTLTGQSKDRNGASCFILLDVGDGTHYEVFYRLVPNFGQDCCVELIVKSAYVVQHPRKNARKFNIRSLIKQCYYKQTGLP